SAHLLLHRVLDGGRRLDGLQLDPVHPDPPPAGRLVQHAAELAVDLVAAGQRLLEVHPADHVPQRGHGELLDRLDVVGDLVDGVPGAGHLEEDHGVDVDRQVVLGDHRLRREGHHPFPQVDLGPYAVDERHHEVQPRVQHPVEPAQPLDHVRLGLLDPDQAPGHHHQHQHDQYRECDEHAHYGSPQTRAVAPLISMTLTVRPTSSTWVG